MWFILNVHRATKSQSWSGASEDQHKTFRITANSSFLQNQLLFTSSDSLGQVYFALGWHNAVLSKVSSTQNCLCWQVPRDSKREALLFLVEDALRISCLYCTKVIPKTGCSHGNNNVEFIRRWKFRPLASFGIWTISFTINEGKSQYVTIFH